MSRIIKPPVADDLDYPTTDGKPMAETDIHIVLMMALILTLRALFADQPRVYVSGNILVFYERGNKRKHVSPDVFMVRAVSLRLPPEDSWVDVGASFMRAKLGADFGYEL